MDTIHESGRPPQPAYEAKIRFIRKIRGKGVDLHKSIYHHGYFYLYWVWEGGSNPANPSTYLPTSMGVHSTEQYVLFIDHFIFSNLLTRLISTAN